MAAVMSRMSAELSTSVPTSLGVSLSGGSYCAAMGRKRGSRPLFHHSQNIMAATISGNNSGQLLRRKSPTLSAGGRGLDGSFVKGDSDSHALMKSERRRGADFDAVSGDFGDGVSGDGSVGAGGRHWREYFLLRWGAKWLQKPS